MYTYGCHESTCQDTYVLYDLLFKGSKCYSAGSKNVLLTLL